MKSRYDQQKAQFFAPSSRINVIRIELIYIFVVPMISLFCHSTFVKEPITERNKENQTVLTAYFQECCLTNGLPPPCVKICDFTMNAEE
uniref:Uncharacterized protein n=1 Tax=Romanomermis culicivorax TaxID=13658 RepID=A0A915K6H8_ROMCU